MISHALQALREAFVHDVGGGGVAVVCRPVLTECDRAKVGRDCMSEVSDVTEPVAAPMINPVVGKDDCLGR